MTSRILIVEDEVLVARDIRARLERMDYIVVGTAARGEDAIEQALTENPDLILMDINLRGEMDGIEAATKINEARSIPVIFCTAYSNDEVLQRAKITTPYGYVLKPFDNRELQIIIEIAIAKHHIDQELSRANTRLDATLENVSDGVVASDASGKICFINNNAAAMLCRESTECIGQPIEVLLRFEPFESGTTAIDLSDSSSYADWKSFNALRQQLVRIGAPKLPVEVSASFVDSSAEELSVISLRDITLQLENEKEIEKAAFYDRLTGLPNRSLFLDRLEASFSRHRRSFSPAHDSAVLFLNLDEFSSINETHGHDIGDSVLCEIGERLQMTLRPDDTVARVSGDVFAILLEPVTGLEGTVTACQRIQAAIAPSVNTKDTEFNFTATIGIAINSNGEYESPDVMMRDADTALHRAKTDSKGSYVVFDRQMYRDALRFVDRKSSMKRGLSAGAFEVHYQPIVSSTTGELSSMEALVRWPCPDGMISPAEFIPMAESTGLIVPLGEYVLRTVCLQIAKWERQGHNGFRVAVNVSPKQFDTNIVELVQDVLAETGVSPTCLTMEITEGMAMGNVDRHAQLLGVLRDMGIEISMDDFGTGYSSLSYLQKFPINTLKIDQSFVREIVDRESDQQIAKTIIGMGRSLNLKTLAEGVEDVEQLEILTSMGCELIQGFYFSKPLCSKEMTNYLQLGNSRYSIADSKA